VSDNKPANVPLRGVGPRAFAIRNTLKVRRRARLTPGMREINVGKQRSGASRADARQRREIRQHGVEGRRIFTADDASFESEVWGDVELMMPAFQRGGYQSVTVKLVDPSAIRLSARRRWPADPRLDLKPQRERDYYDGQIRDDRHADPVFATFVTAILSIGAIFGAMNTMYAPWPTAPREIGTLRALGFSRLRIVAAFLASRSRSPSSAGESAALLLCRSWVVDGRDEHDQLQRAGVQVPHHPRLLMGGWCLRRHGGGRRPAHGDPGGADSRGPRPEEI
jgi:putative ABC transport system permease protein